MQNSFDPVYALTREDVIESTHYGAIVAVDSYGNTLLSHGNSQRVAFLRSSSKPFQVLPFVKADGVEIFGLTAKELALAFVPHEGSDEHVRVVRSMLVKMDVEVADLHCGIHMPGAASAYKRLIQDNALPSPNRNNCSGKHTALLAFAKMRALPLDS